MVSPVLAGPPGECCIQGVKHSGEPNGKTITIAGVPTYISEPPTKASCCSHNNKIILYFADVYGPFYINAQLLQDYYASYGSSQSSVHNRSFLILSQVSSSLGLTTFSETQSTFTPTSRALTGMHGRLSPNSKLKRPFQSGSRQSGKFTVDIINT